jgi:hypothetical protein
VEQTSIGQVAANLKELDPSNVTLQVSSSLMISINKLTISGQILPEVANENVTIQAKINHSNWITIGTVQTQQNGQFQYDWVPPTVGDIAIQASWAGNKQYNGATSAQVSIFIVPWYMVAVVASSALAIIVVFVAFVKLRSKKEVAPSTLQSDTGIL